MRRQAGARRNRAAFRLGARAAALPAQFWTYAQLCSRTSRRSFDRRPKRRPRGWTRRQRRAAPKTSDRPNSIGRTGLGSDIYLITARPAPFYSEEEGCRTRRCSTTRPMRSRRSRCNRPERLNTIVPPMPQELEDAVHTGGRRRAGQGDRAARRRPRVLCRLRLRRRLSSLGRGADDRRSVGSGQGLRLRDGAVARAGAEVHEPVALAEAGHRAGPRLVRRRRQRHGAVRRHRDRQRGRANRHALLAHVGLLPDRACGSTGSG